ncbi:hypothetical protein [Echinicola sp. 20G]|uniref:hypothetical protein n=1 Tax=Echinicola sp. 20G TaxID=2781961 RepID=UPI00191066E1|nr:hypothetical protein [Echinicola sp. 20G]
MTFSALYHVEGLNVTKDLKIFQSKATAEGEINPAWVVGLHVTVAGDIDIIKREITWW